MENPLTKMPAAEGVSMNRKSKVSNEEYETDIDVEKVDDRIRLVQAKHTRPGDIYKYTTLVAVDETNHVHQLEVFSDWQGFDVRYIDFEQDLPGRDVDDVAQGLVEHYKTNLAGFE